MERWREELLTLEGCKEDIDGLVGRGQALLEKEEWEDAVRALEKAFEIGGRGDREVNLFLVNKRSAYIDLFFFFFCKDIAKAAKGEEIVETE
jgi:hypothetical protein